MLWTQQRAVYSSPELSFDGIHQMPKPVQRGGIPVWISGTVNKRVARRLSKFGTRWIPWGPDIANLDESVPAMKQAIADVGGDPSELQVQGTVVLVKNADGAIDINASVAPVPKQVAAGATDMRFAGSLPKDPAAGDRTVVAVGDGFQRGDAGPRIVRADFCVKAARSTRITALVQNSRSKSGGRARSDC